jgi:AGZA family xanthine/uracil permease-like MFS transporter
MPLVRIEAEPSALTVDLGNTALIIIDMQRDFLEPGGFGETLGNDVSLLAAAIEPCRRVLAAARQSRLLVIHTREGHRADLSDAPPAKLERGTPSLRIGAPGPMGRILVRGEPGHEIIDALYPALGEPVIDKPGKGAFYQTELDLVLRNRGIENLLVAGVTTEVCVNILMLGGFIAPYIRRITPRAALLGTLAGVSITFISMRPALEIFMTPMIGIPCLAIILVAWFGGVRYPRGIPAGLVAIAAGMLIAWGSTLVGLDYGGMSLTKVGQAFANFGFSLPLPAHAEVFAGFEYLGIILVTAIPFGIYDLVEAMDNVESAEAAGDAYPTTQVLTADGVVSLIGCLLGNPFINAVYIGHPGWKMMGGRIGYSAATGLMVILLSSFGLVALLLSLVPVVAISPILLYIGMLIGAQAFQETPKQHAPAVILALVPHLAAWCKTLMDGALSAAGTSAHAVGPDKLGQVGVLYQGLEVLGGGAILSGLIFGAVAAFIINREFLAASAFAGVGGLLTFFGFMHGESVGFAVTPSVAVAYGIVAIFLFVLARQPRGFATQQPEGSLAPIAAE